MLACLRSWAGGAWRHSSNHSSNASLQPRCAPETPLCHTELPNLMCNLAHLHLAGAHDHSSPPRDCFATGSEIEWRNGGPAGGQIREQDECRVVRRACAEQQHCPSSVVFIAVPTTPTAPYKRAQPPRVAAHYNLPSSLHGHGACTASTCSCSRVHHPPYSSFALSRSRHVHATHRPPPSYERAHRLTTAQTWLHDREHSRRPLPQRHPLGQNLQQDRTAAGGHQGD